MGRNYFGDIEGKFWFAVQSSNDAEFFGAVEQEPSTIRYYADSLTDAQNGVDTCFKELGIYKDKLDKFFENNNGYNDAMLVKAGFPKDKLHHVLVWYARLQLGQQILDCIKKQDDCTFEAEL